MNIINGNIYRNLVTNCIYFLSSYNNDKYLLINLKTGNRYDDFMTYSDLKISLDLFFEDTKLNVKNIGLNEDALCLLEENEFRIDSKTERNGRFLTKKNNKNDVYIQIKLDKTTVAIASLKNCDIILSSTHDIRNKFDPYAANIEDLRFRIPVIGDKYFD